MKKVAISLTIIVTLAASGCAGMFYQREPDFQPRLGPSTEFKQDNYGGANAWPPYSEVYTQRFVWKMRWLAEQVYKQMENIDPTKTTVLMTTLTPVDDLYKPTGFGRLCMEQLMTEFAKLDFVVIEARKTDNYMIRDHDGEFSLSRDLSKLSKDWRADMVLVGTYSKSDDQVLLNVRLVSTKNGGVIAGATAQMDLRGDKYLGAVFQKDAMKDGSWQAHNGTINIRKRVMEGDDPYAEVLQSRVRDMAERVAETAPPAPGSATQKTVAVATFVDVDHFYRSATFGRYITEQLIGNLQTLGYKVVEIRAAPDMYVDFRLGEIKLSREMSQLVSNTKADAVLLGTYTKAGENVVVNGRLVVNKTQQVIGVGDIVVDARPSNKFVTGLLKNEITSVLPTETVEGY